MNKFSNWLESKGLHPAEFASQINKPAYTVKRWAQGKCEPNKTSMRLIHEVSDGAVTRDFFYSEQGCANTQALNK